MEGKGISFIILLIIVALLTMILAGVVIFFLVTSGNQAPAEQGGKVNVQSIVKPADDELASRFLFEKGIFNLRSEDSDKRHIVRVTVSIKYFKEIKGLEVEKKIDSNIEELKEMVGTYFQDLTLDQIKDSKMKTKFKKELTKKANDLLNENESAKNEIIYTFIFSEFNYE